MTLHFLHKVNVLSVDVALGSVCAALFFGKYLNVHISPIALVVLVLTVWIIYTVDHLMDAKRIVGDASSQRHRFHQQHFITLRNLGIGATIITTCLLVFLPLSMFYHGIVLLAIVMIYILLHSYVPFIKEFSVALIYTAGVFIPASDQLTLLDVPYDLLASFAVVALINLLIFSWFSEHEDRIDGIPSVVTTTRLNVPRVIIPILIALQLLLLFRSGFNFAFITLSCMSGALAGMFFFSDYFRENDRYRVGDAVFFVTLIYVIL